MSTYISFNLPNGKKGVARIFVKENGTDELQLVQNGDGSVASFDDGSASLYVEAKNRRWIEEAELAAAKLSR